MSFDNPLSDPLATILESAQAPVSEYQLIQLLNQQGCSLSTSATDTVALFRSHFLVYNALYQLQDRYWQQQQRLLRISALAIELQSPQTSANNNQRALSDYSNDQALRAYYLDISQLEHATDASVQALLDSFWQRYVSNDEVTEALATLALSPEATYQDVKQQYRRLAMQHHPDRGGKADQFQAINQAFGVLQRYFVTVEN